MGTSKLYSQIVQAPGIETNQGELARPPMMRYSIGDEDSELFSEHRTPGGAVRNVVTEAPRSASFQILPPKPAEVFRTPEECHITMTPTSVKFVLLRQKFELIRPNDKVNKVLLMSMVIARHTNIIL